MNEQNNAEKQDNTAGSRFRRTLIVILLIALIILILLLIRRCTGSIITIHTGSDRVTDNYIGIETDYDPGYTETDHPSDTTGGHDPSDTDDPEDTEYDPDLPPTTSDSGTGDESDYPGDLPPDETTPSSPPTDADDTTTSRPGTPTPSKEIKLDKFFGFIDGKDNFATEDWTPGSKETIGYIISSEYNKDRTLFFTLKINKDITPGDDHTDNAALLADVLTVTIKYYDFKRDETNKDVPPVFTKVGTFSEISALGAIEIGTLPKGKEGTCELEVVMDSSAGNEYAFAKLDAEFLWTAE